jgi:hypothetical protein
MIENLIIAVIFIGALLFLANTIKKQFSAKSDKCAGCSGACQAVNKFDFSEQKQAN